MTNEALIGNLQRRNDGFLNLPNKGFFLGIADYIKYLIETKEFETILISIKKQKETDEQQLTKLGELVRNETEQSAEKLLEKIKKEKISFPKLEEAISEYQGTIEGKVQHLTPYEEALHGELSGVVRTLFENGYKTIASPYLVIFKENERIADFNISKNFSLYSDELKHFRGLSETTIWGAFDSLILVYLVIHQYREEFNRLKSETNIWRRLNFKGLYDEMKIILEGKFSTPIHFIKENYLIYFSRVHNCIVESLQPLDAPFKPTISEAKSETQEEYKNKIDKWLDSKEPWAFRKIWQIVSALNSEWQLRDQNSFKIPFDKFERARITNPKDIEPILTNLHNHKIIEVSLKLGETSPSDNPDKPMLSVWETVIEKPEIVRDSNTIINIYPKEFSYLRDTLIEKIKQENIKKSNIIQQNQTKTQPSSSEVVHCHGLNYSFVTCQLNYKNGASQLMSPETREMRFFLILFNNCNRVMDYKDIARDAKLESYDYILNKCQEPHEKISNSELALDVGMLRRDFRKLVLSLGMPPNEFPKMVKTISKKGYQLTCEES